MKHIFSLSLFLISTFSGFSQEFYLTSGTDNNLYDYPEIARVINIPHDHYLVLFNHYNSDPGYTFPTIWEVDSSGSPKWQQAFSASNSDVVAANDIKLVDGGSNYIVCGSIEENSYDRIFLAKFKLHGGLIWSRYLNTGNNSHDLASEIIVLQDGYLLQSMIGGQSALVKTTPDGQVRWISRYPGIYFTHVMKAGSHLYFDGINNDAHQLLLFGKMDLSGNIEWTKTYKYSTAFGPAPGDFVILRNTILWAVNENQYSPHRSVAALMKLDKNGNILQAVRYTGQDTSQQLTAGGVAMTSEFNAAITLSDNDQGIFLKADSNGNIILANALSIGYPDMASNLRRATDGGFVLFGTARSYSNDYASFGYVQKVNNDGKTFCNDNAVTLTAIPISFSPASYNAMVDNLTFSMSNASIETRAADHVQLACAHARLADSNNPESILNSGDDFSVMAFPNPFSNSFLLRIGADPCQIDITDAAGRIIQHYDDVTGNFSGGETLSNGIYFARVTGSNGLQRVLKLVKTK